MDTALFEGTLVESERILYTPSTFARTNLIHLQECGRLKALSPHTSHRENLASYLCFIVLEAPVPSNTTRSTTRSLPETVCFWTVKRATSTAAPISSGHLNGPTFMVRTCPESMKNIPSAAVLPAFAPKALPRIRKFLTASVKRRLPPIMSAI